MSAVISPCGRYRYLLGRGDNIGVPKITWVMLNPSTADATKDDPTIRRVRDFSTALGFGYFWVVNLYAFRATSPDDMFADAMPVGLENNMWIRYVAARSAMIVSTVIVTMRSSAGHPRARP